MTDYLRPDSLEDALRARDEHPDWLLLAGGTDVMVGFAEKPAPSGVIDVFGLPGLCGVSREPDGTIRIGAATTYADILRSPIVQSDLPALAACVREIGAVQIQARGTLGGNVGTSSPVGDTLPVLLALDARLELASARARREMAYPDFLVGYRKTALAPTEIVAAVRFPVVPGRVQHWRKVGTRKAQAISKVMFAGSASLSPEGKILSPRIALGAVADRPIRVLAAESLLEGQSPSEPLAERARDAVISAIHPITDVRSTAEYRSTVAGNLVRRFVLGLGDAPKA